ncbi:S8 family serine peptidase [Simiduia agarivorans]|uniref:Peptidase S8/S53 subtilisin kexin sedolisin n=1 Tax=Simiduia agarivorans (strain DSM 21679 / JCM 13881 / BCRC 17597 / SA1) TaxID=1117647 RepID=K4KN60_SIMAS|nr:S8 family serine peptidase [Simiduia agarivorans]AFV00477.1 peptidase S8/S53 subtilisin kexin sedolisin [Simiduia agarivorans SA1 = DSM 21679]
MNPKRTAIALALICSTGLPLTGAQAQLINAEPITGALENPVQNAQRELAPIAEPARRAALAAEAAAREAALDPIERSLGNPLAALPDALPILNAQGDMVLQEVITDDGWRAIAGEWLLWLTGEELNTLNQPGITLISATPMPALGKQLVRFRVTQSLDQRSALQALLPAHLHPMLDRNHTYDSQSGAEDIAASNRSIDRLATPCPHPVKVGMVDTGIQVEHPAFSHRRITRADFLPADLIAPDAHGTAVAGVLVGEAEGLTPRLGAGHLFAAAAFYQRSDFSQGATTDSLIQALNWLSSQEVRVINLSLAGPPNKLLGIAIELIHAQGIALVAAVGNEGPAAPPLYPAAFEPVIGVTAVDARQAIYRWANQGHQVDFSAPGVSVITARAINPQQSNPLGRESGTSMAAPVIAAHLACLLARGERLETALSTLRAQATDLGAPGRDTVFGEGWLP